MARPYSARELLVPQLAPNFTGPRFNFGRKHRAHFVADKATVASVRHVRHPGS